MLDNNQKLQLKIMQSITNSLKPLSILDRDEVLYRVSQNIVLAEDKASDLLKKILTRGTNENSEAANHELLKIKFKKVNQERNDAHRKCRRLEQRVKELNCIAVTKFEEQNRTIYKS